MKFFHKRLLAVLIYAAPALSYAGSTTFPTVNAAGNGKNSTPITAFVVPNDIPAADLPTPGGNAVSLTGTIQSYAASQATPTSAAPTCGEPPATSQYMQNEYDWPTAAQSITWWEEQSDIPAAGTYAYQVGATYSHQDAEGWAGSCTVDPQPCPSGPGEIQETWGGGGSQGNGWTGSCSYMPPPSCSTLGAGYTGDYTWNSSTNVWQNSCTYTPAPSCAALGAGHYGTYTWNTSSQQWLDTCDYAAAPNCSSFGAGYSGSYTWNPSVNGWEDTCTYAAQPSCSALGAGWTGNYTWNSASASWSYSSCIYQAPPSCPAGYTGGYAWNGSSWVDECVDSTPGVTANIVVDQVLGGRVEEFYEQIEDASGTCTSGQSYEITGVLINGGAVGAAAAGWQYLADHIVGVTLACSVDDPLIGQYTFGYVNSSGAVGVSYPADAIPTSAGTISPNSGILSDVSGWSGY